MLGAAGGAHPQMQADAREPGRGVLPAQLGLDVAVEQGAGDATAGVAVVDLEDRLEEGTIARSGHAPHDGRQTAGLVDAQVAIDAVRDDGLPGLELEALAVQRDLDAVGLEGDEVADRRHVVERRAVGPRGVRQRRRCRSRRRYPCTGRTSAVST